MSDNLVDVWFPFATAAVFVVTVNIAWYLRMPQLFHQPRYVWLRIGIFALPGAALAVSSAVTLPQLVAASERYQTDPSCLPGSMSDRPVPAGPCSVVHVALRNAVVHSGGRSGTHYYITAVFPDGTTRDVELAYVHDGANLFHGVQAIPDTAARAQIFEGRIIMLTSDRGNATTRSLPQSRARNDQLVGGLGVGLLIGGFLNLLVSWRVIFG